MLQDAWSMCTCSNVESYQGSIVVCLARSCGNHLGQRHACTVLKELQLAALKVLQGGSCQSPRMADRTSRSQVHSLSAKACPSSH